jgi:biotin carboxyl carrier protein
MKHGDRRRIRRAAIPVLGACLAAACLQRQVQKVRQAEAHESAAEPSYVTQQSGESGVTLDSATVARIGLRSVELRPATRRDETDLPAVIVPDPEATSFVRAGVAGRLVVPEAVAWPRFGTRIEAGAVVGVIGDARPITAPRGGTVSRVLAQPGELVQPGQELLEVTAYDAPLAKVAWSPDLPEPPAGLSFSVGSEGPRVEATLVGPAPEADPVTRSPAWLYRIRRGWQGMRPGASVTAHLTDARGIRRGVVVPAGAVVQWDALAWTYQEKQPGRFVRVRVPTDWPTAGGWLVSGPLAPGDRVVITGAGQLLSEEFRARIVVGEEVGE